MAYHGLLVGFYDRMSDFAIDKKYKEALDREYDAKRAAERLAMLAAYRNPDNWYVVRGEAYCDVPLLPVAFTCAVTPEVGDLVVQRTAGGLDVYISDGIVKGMYRR